MMRDLLTKLFARRPFEPFALVTADGRAIEVRNPEQGAFGTRVESLFLFHPDRKIEVLDVSAIVSVRTTHPAATVGADD